MSKPIRITLAAVLFAAALVARLTLWPGQMFTELGSYTAPGELTVTPEHGGNLVLIVDSPERHPQITDRAELIDGLSITLTAGGEPVELRDGQHAGYDTGEGRRVVAFNFRAEPGVPLTLDIRGMEPAARVAIARSHLAPAAFATLIIAGCVTLGLMLLTTLIPGSGGARPAPTPVPAPTPAPAAG